jgi:uncharacterized membrane protein YhhN
MTPCEARLEELDIEAVVNFITALSFESCAALNDVFFGSKTVASEGDFPGWADLLAGRFWNRHK